MNGRWPGPSRPLDVRQQGRDVLGRAGELARPASVHDLSDGRGGPGVEEQRAGVPPVGSEASDDDDSENGPAVFDNPRAHVPADPALARVADDTNRVGLMRLGDREKLGRIAQAPNRRRTHVRSVAARVAPAALAAPEVGVLRRKHTGTQRAIVERGQARAARRCRRGKRQFELVPPHPL